MLPRRQLYFATIVSYTFLQILPVHVRHRPREPRPAPPTNTPPTAQLQHTSAAERETNRLFTRHYAWPLLRLGLALGLVFVRAVEKTAALHVGHTRRRDLLLLLDTGEVLVVKENHEQDKVGGVHDEAQLPVGRIDKAIVTTHLHPCCG